MVTPEKKFPLVLTAHPRLARWLMLEYNEQQKNKKAWETPEILPLSAWLKNFWLETWPEKHILSNIQSESLWEKIVDADHQVKSLSVLHKKAVAIQAQKAYSLINEYKIPLLKKNFQETLETLSFFQWAESFEKQLGHWGAIDSSQLMDYVCESIEKGKTKLPTKIYFKGFDKKYPQLQSLLDAIQRKGTQTELPDLFLPESEGSISHISVQKYDDKNQEATTCARWIRKNYQPGKRFGVIVPDLKNYHSILQRELAAELCPSSIFPENKTELPFNISLGSPLSQITPINLILDLLSTPSCTIPAGTFYSIIKYPVFNLENEATIAIETEFRKQRKFNIDISDFRFSLDSEKAPRFFNLMVAWKSWVLDSNKFLPNKWAEKISFFLKEVNWPGKEEKLTDKENHIFESWKNCLDQLASLNSILGPIHRIEAIKNLSGIAEKCFFPEKNRDHLIQVVQLDEATGMKFDHSWVMGCHFEALPPSPDPNTFVPSEFRKRHQIPHSSAKWELENCEQQLKRISTSSKDIVLSYPLQDGDNSLEPSPLIKKYPQDNSLVLPSARIKDQISNSIALEKLDEEPYLLLTGDEKIRFDRGQMKGGSSLLKNQADCPFQAFSRFRLHATNQEIPDTDFDPMVRGNLVHRILEIFWRKVKTREQLVRLHKTGQLEKQLEILVKQAMEKFSRALTDQKEFLKLEESRNIKLVFEWLVQFEMERDNFTVLEPEKEETVYLNGLSLTLRMDRIDETEGKKHVLIDYKTGEANPSEWVKERILSPQLPLYATLISPTAVYFAQTKKGGMGLKGIKESFKNVGTSSIQFVGFNKPVHFSELLEGPTWNNLLDFWKRQINGLASEFLEGRISIDPAQKQNTCRNCDLNPVCRIWERDDGIGELD